jgi:heat-inducible transcriptional repressor
MDLTHRQIQIIKAIVSEYTETANPVGSVTLEHKYRLGVSPATLRNEMAELTKKGYLVKTHASAGRFPTAKSIKFYVNEILEEQRLSVAEEVSVREAVWENRDNLDSLLKEATKALSERTRSLSVISLDDNVYHHGYSYILDAQDMCDFAITRQILSLLDHQSKLADVFSRNQENDPIHLLIGNELGSEILSPVSCVYADIHVGDKRGSLGIFASSRQTYQHNIPLVRFVANLVNQIAQDW